MREKKISIIIPAYNAEKYIRQCIESLIRQTYYNIEIIVVDDGSKDLTGKIIDEYGRNEIRIKVIHQKNGGLSNARNTGMKYVTGEYIMFLDADDWLEDDCCEIAYKEASKEKADLIFFEYSKEYKDKTIGMQTYQMDKLIYEKYGKKQFFIYDMRTITAWGKLYSTELINGQTFNENMKTAEDVDFNFRIYERVNKAIYIRKQLLHYRMLDKSAIHGYDSQIHKNLEYVLDSLEKWSCGDEEKSKAYYSFAAIAFMLVCQNEICLNVDLNFIEKMKKISALNLDNKFKNMLENIQLVEVPFSRKCLLILEKMKLSIIIVGIIEIKQKFENRS